MTNGPVTRAHRKGLHFGVLLRTILAFCLAVGAGRLALFLAPWPLPIKYASLAALLVSIGLIFLGAKWAWQWLRTISLRRALLLLLLCYALAVIIVGVGAWGRTAFPAHALEVAISVPTDVGAAAYRGVLALVQFPGRFGSQFSGSEAVDPAARVTLAETPAPANAPIAPIQIQVNPATARTRVFSVGDAATAADQASARCQMDAFAERPFTAGTKVRLVEGPRHITDEAWWRVRSETATGWCPGSALLP